MTIANSVKTLFRTVQSSPLQLRFITTLHSFVSPNFHNNFYYGSFRYINSAPTHGEEASVDNRVPATIITGFLGSGKVLRYFIFCYENSLYISA